MSKFDSRRRVVLTIETNGIESSEALQHAVDRVLKIWMARGGGLNDFTEDLGDYGRLRASLHVSHLWLEPQGEEHADRCE